MDIYQRLNEMGYQLPELPPKGGIYKPVVKTGNLLYISGQGATEKGVPVVVGKVGKDLTIEEGQRAAQICALNALAVLHDYLGDLNKVSRIVKMLTFVASADDFNFQPKVGDGASALFRDLFGEENGIGARSAIGVNELPGNIAVEIEFIFEIKE